MTNRTFEVKPSVRQPMDSHLLGGRKEPLSGYEVVFYENGSVVFSNFFASEWVTHKEATFDVGFEQACMMGHNFIGGGNG